MQNQKNANPNSLSFIIPAYNDEKTIETVVANVFETGRRLHLAFNVIVINDASADGTGDVLKKLAAHHTELKVITHAINAGYGATIKELYEKADKTWLFSLPGDYQIEPAELAKLWPHRNEADMLLGFRKARQDSRARRRQSGIYNGILRLLFRIKLHDINSVRLMKMSVIKSVSLTTNSAFVDAELVIRAKRAGFKIIEIPIAHRARAGAGASGGKMKIILPTILDMVKFFL